MSCLKLVLLSVPRSHCLSDGLQLMSMALALPGVFGLVEVFPMVAEVLNLEEVKILVQQKLSPAEGPVSFVLVAM